MMKLALAAAALLVAAGPAGDHGGKIKWTEPKNLKDFESMIAQSDAAGRAIIMYFTQDG
jgi:hypothetical protein